MAVTSYSTLKTSVADWLDRSDIGTAIDTMIDLCEARIYRELRLRFMESSLSVTISSGVAAVPSDYIELKSAHINTNPIQHLQPKSQNWIETVYPERSSSGVPHYIARQGDNFIFGPYPDSDYTLAGTYYAKPTALSTSNETNWLTSNAPDLLLYGALVHSAPYIGHDERAPLWEAGYQDALARVMNTEREENYPRHIPLRMTTA